jgi:hypothetical protein
MTQLDGFAFGCGEGGELGGQSEGYALLASLRRIVTRWQGGPEVQGGPAQLDNALLMPGLQAGVQLL